jgi:hypothetical protein
MRERNLKGPTGPVEASAPLLPAIDVADEAKLVRRGFRAAVYEARAVGLNHGLLRLL